MSSHNADSIDKMNILLVDDDESACETMRKILDYSGYSVTCAFDGKQALDFIREKTFDLVLTDVRMPGMGGLELLRALSLCGNQTPVVLMTAFGRVQDAVWAMKLGAVDFLTKPFKRQQLIAVVEGAARRAKGNLKPVSVVAMPSDQMIGESEGMRTLKKQIQQIAATSANVLIFGESGTGKERVAQLLHQQSVRSKAAFVAVNCAALPESLIESEFFGHEKGAFTGAVQQKRGLFEVAQGGTLFLDEIGDMPLVMQAKLLRVLQEGEIRRVGATGSLKVDVRVIAATHRDLRLEVQSGRFREDLLFRLEVFQLKVPALRERGNDMVLLAKHFLSEYAQRHNKKIHTMSRDVHSVIFAHTWPGNVRELSNVIERAVVFAQSDVIELCDFPDHLVTSYSAFIESEKNEVRSASSLSGAISVPLGTSLKDVEELLIRKTLEATDGDKNMTARLLGVNSRTIYRKLEQKPE